MAEETEIYIGTAGWDYPDWRGNFFPPRLPRGLHPLNYLASYFNTVEVNSSFYRPPRRDYAERWLDHVAGEPRFTFTVKLWQRFTHERQVRPLEEDVEIFKQGISPLLEAGKLGGLLAQFPWSFRNIEENRDWLRGVLDAFAEYPLVLEVRHASWNVPEVYAALQKRRVAICNIDQPLFRDSVEPDSKVTARVGYVRLHGQNHSDWFREDAGRDARYNYLYSQEELEPWVEKIKEMRKKAERLYVITNNHYKGQAAVNALQIVHMITGEKVKAPASLIKAFPQLAPICKTQGPGGQLDLFGS